MSKVHRRGVRRTVGHFNGKNRDALGVEVFEDIFVHIYKYKLNGYIFVNKLP